MGISKRSSPYYPQCDSKVEVKNKYNGKYLGDFLNNSSRVGNLDTTIGICIQHDNAQNNHDYAIHAHKVLSTEQHNNGKNI
jgi:hypothetical protein